MMIVQGDAAARKVRDTVTSAQVAPPREPDLPPAQLRDLPAWLVWKFEPNEKPGGKPRKVPYYAAGGRRYGVHGAPEDRHQLVAFDAARAAAARRGYDGVGFAPMGDFGIVALDFDACVVQGKVIPEVADLLDGTYAEFSPSGLGVRAFFTGQLGNLKSHANAERAFGVELFSSKGFVTFTGNVLPACEAVGNDDVVAPVDERLLAFIQRRFATDLERAGEAANYDDPPLGLTKRQIDQALEVLPVDLDYDSWVQVGMGLHHEYRGGDEGFEVWDTWSQRSPKYTSREYGLERWHSFGKGQHDKIVTARSLVHLANENGAHIDVNAPASAEDFDAVNAAAGSGKPSRFPVLQAAEIAARPAPTWIIKGVLPRAELVVIFGEPGSGKTFMVLDLAAAVAQGLPWRGKRAKRGRVVYIAAEGAGSFRNRFFALARHLQVDVGAMGIEAILGTPNFLQKEDPLEVARSIGTADLIIVDTLAQVTPGGNENGAEDMGKALAHCKGLHRATGATVLLVHHAGKDLSRGARGWSGLRAAADAELEVSRDARGERALRISKQKDGQDNEVFGFELEQVELGLDEDGDPITSCVVVETAAPTLGVVKPLGALEQIVHQVIQELAQAGGVNTVKVDDVLTAVTPKLDPPAEGQKDRRRERAKKSLRRLTEHAYAPYRLEGEHVRID